VFIALLRIGPPGIVVVVLVVVTVVAELIVLTKAAGVEVVVNVDVLVTPGTPVVVLVTTVVVAVVDVISGNSVTVDVVDIEVDVLLKVNVFVTVDVVICKNEVQNPEALSKDRTSTTTLLHDVALLSSATGLGAADTESEYILRSEKRARQNAILDRPLNS